MNKAYIRKKILSKRNDLSDKERYEKSQVIAGDILYSEWFNAADIVLSYASFGSEVITDHINKKVLDDGKKLYLPKTYTDKNEMIFYRIESMDDLTSGAMGIREPFEGEAFHTGFIGTKECYDNLDTTAVEPWENAIFHNDDLSSGGILMLMPGVVFDDGRHRIGYGGGYYDRFLAKYGKMIDNKVMIAFDIQREDDIPYEHTDICPDMILTETKTYGNIVR